MSSTRRGESKGGTLEEEQAKAAVSDVFEYPGTGIGPVFAAIESSIICAICRAISEPPLSLPCCQQVYCSLCIRETLDCIKPRCPRCRASAAQNQLKLSKKLRSVCSIWKRHRKSILAVAMASAKAGEVDVAPVFAEEPSSGRQSGRPGQGRDAGRLTKGLFYHSMKEGKLRELLRKAGLPSDGNKEAMVARYKRLVLLDTCSNDREVPLPRSELIKQVKRWEVEKVKKKRDDAARAARASSSPATPVAAGAEGQGEAESAADRLRLPPQSKESKDHFAEMLKNYKRGREGAGDGCSKKRRVWRDPLDDPLDEDDSAVTNGALGSGVVGSGAVTSGAVGNGAVDGGAVDSGAVATGAVGSGAVSNGAVASGAVASGAVGSGCVVSPTPERPLLMVDPNEEGARAAGAEAEAAAAVAAGSEDLERSSPVPASSELKVDGGGAAEMRILGVAGKMVRTGGPWRCVFSTGALSSGARGNEAGAAKEEPPTSASSAGGPGANGPATASALGGRESRLLLPPSSSSSSLSPLLSPPLGVARGGGASTAIVGPVAASEATSEGGTFSVECHGSAAVGDAERGGAGGGGSGSGPSSRGVDAPTLEGEGIVYLNAATGETVREPPAELVAQAEEAEKAGDYLVFIPCRSFVAAVMAYSSTAVAAAAVISTPSIQRMSGAASAVGSGAEPLLPTAGRRSNTAGSRDDDGWTLNQLSTPSPLVANAPAAPGGSGGGGVGTWDRLSVVSAAGTTPSHPRVSLPTIDLSQGAPAPPPLLVVDDGDGGSAGSGSGGGGSGKGGVEVVGVGARTGAAEEIWTCVACTLQNGVRHVVCEVCRKARPKTFRSQRLAQSASSFSSAASGSGSRRPQSRLRLPTQRANGDSAPQSAITSFTSRPESSVKGDSSSSSSSSSTRGCGNGKGGDGDCETK